MSRGVVVIGAGQAACQLVASLRQMKYQGKLTVVGEERSLPYQRPPLSKGLLNGKSDFESIHLRTLEFYDKIGCELRTGVRAVSVNREKRVVELENGDDLNYDTLVFATGARPKAYPGLDIDAKNLHYLRTLEDAKQLAGSLVAGRSLAIIGGGYVGLEVAASARQQGVAVTVYEAASRVMLRSVGPKMSSIIQDIHVRQGVHLHLGAKIEQIDHDPLKDSFSIITASHGAQCFDALLIGIGAQANIELAAVAGLACGRGILVDANCRTSDPSVFAIGDCTEQDHAVYGPGFRLESVQNAVDQAKCAASSIVGSPKPMRAIPWFWSDQYEHRIQVVGFPSQHDVSVLREDAAEASDARSVWYLKDNRVVAVETLDSPRDFMMGRAYIQDDREVEPQSLVNGDFSA